MDSIVSYFADFGMDIGTLMRFSGAILLGALLVSGICRFIFRRQTMLGHAISSSIAILFIYIITVLMMTVFTQMRAYISPLPFVTITSESISFFSFHGANYSVIASELLSMIILAFIVNLVDSWLPRGRNLLNWLFFRCLTVAVGFLMHYLVTWLFNRYCPMMIVQYAPAVLLALLILMLLTGALRFIVGLLLTTVNPVIAALYTFFFASLVGKQITKAVMTTAILSGVVLLLEDLGVATISLVAGALVAYIPFLLLLILVWYVVSRP